jgi:hypothetical protein
MTDWNNLFTREKQFYLDRAKEYLDKGLYQGFNVEELAVIIYKNERKHLQ